MGARSVRCPFGEDTIGEPLPRIQDEYPDIAIGSCSKHESGRFWTDIVLRVAEETRLGEAETAVSEMIAGLHPR
ncbi:MAG: hypothetical protein WAU86_10405 [Oricola sp.]